MKRLLTASLLLALSACATTVIGTALPPTVQPERLRERVAAFAQPTPDGRLAALKAQMDATGLSYAVEEFDGPQAKGYNVVARSGPETGKEILLVAHYDALKMPNGRLVDGVVDNAASVVAMIEAMQRISGRTKHPVRLLLTDQEELGLLGARAFIQKHGAANLVAVINADVNAYGDTLMYGLNNGPQSAFMVEAVRQLCAARTMPCLDFPVYPPSDDQAFSAAGAPTISLGHQPPEEAEKLKLFMNPPPNARVAAPEILRLIHTPQDKLDRVDPATLARAADIFTALVMKLDAELP